MITLVLGGARSGKSAVAERLAAARAGAGRPVTYVATAVVACDPDLADRVAAHRARRPGRWRTVEAGLDLVGALAAVPPRSVTVVEALGTWVAGHPGFGADHHALGAALAAVVGDVVVVSDEVGLGVHPSTDLGRRFRVALGTVNQAVADVADEVLFVVAGRVLPLGPAL
ncbi:MAG: bifunctional adenosylcobinamide kinase/adenosylcobinamide-phosphate guanylyltransferase [Acidimicrobiia bacterium]